jgi:D-threonate/D-erythronate kinase
MNDFFLADDLSGALDAAAAFHRAGRRVRVVLQSEAWAEAMPGEIVGVTTETRNARSDTAAAAVRQAIAIGEADGGKLLYKKIDSTLRGQVAAETKALLAALPGMRVLFAPANPRVGRTVESGLLRVNGVPLAQTEFARDPVSPRRESEVRAILGDAALPAVVIPDIRVEADLVAAVEAMESGETPWVPVGSGALAIPIAARCRAAQIAAGTFPPVERSPVLMLGGSAHPLNRNQSRHLSYRHGVRVEELAFDRAEDVTALTIETLRCSGCAALHLPLERIAPTVALHAIVDAAARIIAEAHVRRVFVTGGETAYALCDRIGVTHLLFIDELEPGLGLAIGESRFGRLLLAVKPGGFGNEETWAKAWSRLRT